MTTGGAVQQSPPAKLTSDCCFGPSGERVSSADGSSAAFSDQHSPRDDSLTVAPIRSLRKALISQPKPSSWQTFTAETSRRLVSVRPARGRSRRTRRTWQRPSMANMQPAGSISSTVNGPQPTLDGRSRDAASHRRLARPMAAKCLRAKPIGSRQPDLRPSPARRGTAPEGVEARRVAAPELRSIMSLVRGRQGSAGRQKPGPRAIARAASRGPRRAGATAADVWADLRPQRCMYSEPACRCLQKMLADGCDAVMWLCCHP